MMKKGALFVMVSLIILSIFSSAHVIFAETIHDVSVTNVTASPTTVEVEEGVRGVVTFTISLRNLGTVSETFRVICHGNLSYPPSLTESDIQFVDTTITLDSGTALDLQQFWTASYPSEGDFYIVRVWAEAMPVPDETDLSNNYFSGLTINVERQAPPPPPPGPIVKDLTVSDVWLSPWPVGSAVYAGIYATIRNNGNIYEHFPVEIYFSPWNYTWVAGWLSLYPGQNYSDVLQLFTDPQQVNTFDSVTVTVDIPIVFSTYLNYHVDANPNDNVFNRTYVVACARVSGLVQDEAGIPIPSVLIVVQDASTGLEVASATSDITGRYSVSVPTGVYNLVVTPPPESGFASKTVHDIEVTSDLALDIVLAVAPPASGFLLNVQIVDQYGNPPFDPNDEALFVNDSTGWLRGPNMFSVRLNPGLYTFRMYVSAPWGTALDARTSIDLQQDTNVTYTLQTRVLSGKVLDPQGNPQSGVGITASGNCVFDGLGGTFSSCPAGSDAQGNFVLTVFASNDVQIAASPPIESPYGSVTVSGIDVTEDANVVITLSAPASGFLLNVQIVDQYGNPPFDPNDEALFVNDSTGWLRGPNMFSVRLNPGLYTFRMYVSAPWGTALDARTSIDLQQDTNVTYTLQTRVLSGKVLDPQGNPQSGVGITASGNIAFDGLGGTFSYPGVSDAQGNFALTVFECNNVTLTASPPIESPYGSVTVSGIDVTQDKTVVIALFYRARVGDVNVDGKVDGKDLGWVAWCFGSYPGAPPPLTWDPNCDINNDGKVDGKDLGMVAMHFGEYSP